MMTHTAVAETCNEWTSACEVQQRFMQHPRPAIESLDFSAHCRQVDALGGDFYDFVPLSGDRVAIAVGDASGKGLPAALMIANVQSSLRTASWFAGGNGPAAVEAVNCQVYESSLADRYATLFYGVFDRRYRTLRYVNAGHNPPMVIRRDGTILWLETGGAPVGMFESWRYEEGTVELHPGDILIAYSDGVIEATRAGGEEWGLDGLQRVVAECRGQSTEDLVHAIFTAMDEHTNGRQTDDATVVALQVH